MVFLARKPPNIRSCTVSIYTVLANPNHHGYRALCQQTYAHKYTLTDTHTDAHLHKYTHTMYECTHK